jgi:hypothetical protein
MIPVWSLENPVFCILTSASEIFLLDVLFRFIEADLSQRNHG